MKKFDVVSELVSIASADASDFVYLDSDEIVRLKPISEIPENKRKALALVKNSSSKGGVEIKLYDKLKALELLGKAFGIFVGSPEIDEETAEKLDKIMEQIGGD